MRVSALITMRGLCKEAIVFYKEVLDVEVVDIVTFAESEQLIAFPKEGFLDCIFRAELLIKRKGVIFSIIVGDSPSILFETNFSMGYPENVVFSPNMGKGCVDNVVFEISDDDEEWIKEKFNKLIVGGKTNFHLQSKSPYRLFGSLIDKYGICWTLICP